MKVRDSPGWPLREDFRYLFWIKVYIQYYCQLPLSHLSESYTYIFIHIFISISIPRYRYKIYYSSPNDLHLGCYNKKYHRLGGLKTFISYSSEGWEVHDQGSWWGLISWLLDGCVLEVPSYDRRGKRTLWGLYHKGTNTIHESFILMTKSPLKSPTFYYHHNKV